MHATHVFHRHQVPSEYSSVWFLQATNAHTDKSVNIYTHNSLFCLSCRFCGGKSTLPADSTRSARQSQLHSTEEMKKVTSLCKLMPKVLIEKKRLTLHHLETFLNEFYHFCTVFMFYFPFISVCIITLICDTKCQIFEYPYFWRGPKKCFYFVCNIRI